MDVGTGAVVTPREMSRKENVDDFVGKGMVIERKTDFLCPMALWSYKVTVISWIIKVMFNPHNKTT